MRRRYGQSMHPCGQVPFSGMLHVGPKLTGPGTSQQSIPAPQHIEPQQKSNVGHAPVHGGVPHCPWSQ
jgi:hypothetical protein